MSWYFLPSFEPNTFKALGYKIQERESWRHVSETLLNSVFTFLSITPYRFKAREPVIVSLGHVSFINLSSFLNLFFSNLMKIDGAYKKVFIIIIKHEKNMDKNKLHK